MPSNRFHLLPLLMIAALPMACQPATDTATEVADLVLVGGKLVTVDDSLPSAEALAAKDGRIVAIGTRQDVEPWIGEATEVIDLEGQLAIPGFIDAHAHFMGVGDSRLQLDLRSAGSWQAIVDQVAEAVTQSEPGEWIRGRGWHQDKWDSVPAEQISGFPVHAGLSAISPDNPVLLTHASGHAIFVNAKAMELAGVDAETPDPAGGDILHDAAGQPTGLFNETAAGLIHAARGGSDASTPGEMRKMVELASEECLQKGITSFHDAGSPFEVVDFLRQSAEDGSLGVRLWMMVEGDVEELGEKLAEYRSDGDEQQMVAVGGIKRYMDGALGSRGAWLLEPYEDQPDTTGLQLSPIEELREVAQLAIEHRYQLCIHAIGDRGNREVLDLFEQTFQEHPDRHDLRWRIEHAQHLNPEDIPRFAKLGVIASMQGVHCTSDGPWVPERIGEARAEAGAYVWQTLLDSGAKVINGTDAPVEDVSPLANFHSTVSRRLPDGSQFYPNQALSREQALRATTLDAAYGAFQEDLKGSLSVGKLADITVLSQDIMTIPEEDIPATEVVYTIVGGKVAFRR